ncbi:peptidylprolyl isomerase [Saccharopolyspora pogona]|uniref:peptidylprolyl isomerase n=1 Tax=Saccharopolyspora pogona TaxID=333966 RepID=UPI001CC267EB|nr:peptidylprolyl isomerase [Saccharopolyspora pogona]
MFSELTQALRRKKYDWPTVGVPDWEATVNELAKAPIPSLFLTLSQYAHFMLCTAGMDNAYVHTGQQRRVPESDYEDFRSNLRTMLATDWPEYIQGPDTNGSQIFIVHSHAKLKPAYALLGRVVEGMEVLDEIVAGGVIPGESGDQDGEPALPVEIENIKIRL